MRSQTAEAIMRECARLGIENVRIHRSAGTASVAKAATDYCRGQDITVIRRLLPADVRAGNTSSIVSSISRPQAAGFQPVTPP
jgi:hypothetical protein